MPTEQYNNSQKQPHALVRYGFLVTVTVILIIYGFFVSVYLGGWSHMPDKYELASIRQHKASVVYASGGELLGKFYTKDRLPVGYYQMPNHLREALIATEDARFYSHDGFDLQSGLRVLFQSVLMGDESSGGGSTLSQQLIKNIYPRESHGKWTMLVNKVREIILARRLEKVYSKDELITLYLNTVPFSDNTYGVESASLRFFNKSTSELNVIEAATLVGTLKATSRYNPRLFPERAKQRRNTVLAQMQKYGYINESEVATLTGAPLTLDYRSFAHDKGLAPYFRNELKKELKAWLATYNEVHGTSYNLYRSGLVIKTTLDYDMQAMAEKAMKEHMSELQKVFNENHNSYFLTSESAAFRKEVKATKIYRKYKRQGLNEQQIFDSLSVKKLMELWSWEGKHVYTASTLDSLAHYRRMLNTGMLSLDPRNGAIKVWVGGANYRYFKYDHVRQSQRQIGSTFKPILYASALQSGVGACKFYSATPTIYKDHGNWVAGDEKLERGKLYSMRGALSNSINIVSVKVMKDVGVKNTVRLASEMGLGDLPHYPSIALGTPEVSMMNIAQAYTAFLNDGRVAKPYFITEIANHKGRTLANFQPSISEDAVISERTRQITLDFMKGVVNEGTAGRLRWKYKLNNDIAGKTGTTQGNRDGWFVGLTPRLLNVTWVGNDYDPLSFKSTRLGQGANTALPIFAKFFQRLNELPEYDYYTKAKFPELPEYLIDEVGCPMKKDFSNIKRGYDDETYQERLRKIRLETERTLKNELSARLARSVSPTSLKTRATSKKREEE